ncbi:DegT/DnrJ/EryC1/StrS family aminotransferase [Amorphus sp. MBR-141]
MTDKPIYVTEPFLPPLEDFVPYLEKIWERKWLTNNGAFHQQLEAALCGYLGVDQVSLFTNGTIALVTALQALGVKGEVITTPYSFVATAHSLVWNDLTPVFVDIDPQTMNLDPGNIEAAITPQTTAILAVHCYGVPCDVVRIREIAATHGLKVIYDAAHAFGVRLRGEGLMRHGDLSVLSFHATKVFNTFEGGAIVSPDAEAKQHIDYLKNFGFADEVTVVEAGINGKMNEVQAAMGLLQLQHVDGAIARRREIHRRYCEGLRGIAGIATRPAPAETDYNYAYFPILVGPDYALARDALYERLKEAGIFGRRYFFPLISTMPMYRDLASAAADNLPVATRIANEVICLPIYPALRDVDQDRVIAVIRASSSQEGGDQ